MINWCDHLIWSTNIINWFDQLIWSTNIAVIPSVDLYTRSYQKKKKKKRREKDEGEKYSKVPQLKKTKFYKTK